MKIDFNEISVEEFNERLAEDILHGTNFSRIRILIDARKYEDVLREIHSNIGAMKTLLRITDDERWMNGFRLPDHLRSKNVDKIFEIIKEKVNVQIDF